MGPGECSGRPAEPHLSSLLVDMEGEWQRGVSGFPRVCDSGGVDLRTWITTDLTALRDRFHHGIAAHVPPERWTARITPGDDDPQRPGRPSSSIAWLLFHLSYHQDLAISSAVLGRAPLLVERRGGLGIAGAAPEAGLPEREDPVLADALDPQALSAYFDDVVAATLVWVGHSHPDALDAVPDACRRIEDEAGVRAAEVPWLHAMWEGKPVAWFAQWEAVGHGHTHVGEMTGLRGQLGLSPF